MRNADGSKGGDPASGRSHFRFQAAGIPLIQQAEPLVKDGCAYVIGYLTDRKAGKDLRAKFSQHPPSRRNSFAAPPKSV